MKIAQVPPLYESVPPKLYGGTERVVAYLTEELIAKGQDVTIFGTGDSVTSAKLHQISQQALRLDPGCKDALAWHTYQLQEVVEHAEEFDIIHFHTDYPHFPISTLARYTHLTTLHGRLDLDDLKPIYRKFKSVPLVSISNDQRKPLPNVNWMGTVYHGLPRDLLQLGEGNGGYLAFLGRISLEKRPDKAIEIAKRTGIPLKIAAKIDKADKVYYEQFIEPLIDGDFIQFIGEINEQEKQEFLGEATALIFPIDWPEPFGLVLIEAMACGTPIVAYDCGSVSEIVIHGQSGFIVHSIEEAINAIERIHTLDRSGCRAVFEERFTAPVMANNYMKIYEKLLGHKISRNKYVANGTVKLLSTKHYERHNPAGE